MLSSAVQREVLLDQWTGKPNPHSTQWKRIWPSRRFQRLATYVSLKALASVVKHFPVTKARQMKKISELVWTCKCGLNAHGRTKFISWVVILHFWWMIHSERFQLRNVSLDHLFLFKNYQIVFIKLMFHCKYFLAMCSKTAPYAWRTPNLHIRKYLLWRISCFNTLI